jgi:REP element-mobilizing transposase RayT
MGRKRRQVAEPCCYPITQRCQERRFLLARELDRRNYVQTSLYVARNIK